MVATTADLMRRLQEHQRDLFPGAQLVQAMLGPIVGGAGGAERGRLAAGPWGPAGEVRLSQPFQEDHVVFDRFALNLVSGSHARDGTDAKPPPLTGIERERSQRLLSGGKNRALGCLGSRRVRSVFNDQKVSAGGHRACCPGQRTRARPVSR